MEGLLVILGLALLAVPLAVIYLLIATSGLRRRLTQAEQKVAMLEIQADRKLPLDAAAAIEKSTLAQPEAQPRAGAETPEKRPADNPATPDPVKTPEPVAARREEAKTTQPAPPREPAKPDMFDSLFKWLIDNWFYVVAAISLALAGVFLVQYGMESGLLPPIVRVLGAVGFGGALVLAGEYIRKRWGDGEDSTTAYLPSVFSGAGIVTLFGAILSARLLYDMIGPGTALVGLVAVALGAMVLGWLHGPLLAAVGVVGAMGAPFFVGGSSDDPSWLFGYYAIITGLGLAIDTMRRWAWISVLTLVLGLVGAVMVSVGAPGTEWAFILFLLVYVAISIVIPARGLRPDQSGPMVAEMLRTRGKPWPEFPTRLAFGAVLAASVLLVLVSADGEAESWLAILGLAVLCGVLTIWSSTGRALQDVALLPAVGLLLAPLWLLSERADIWERFAETYAETPEAGFPLTVTVLVALAGMVSVLFAWRSAAGRYKPVWGAAAALFALAMAVLLEISWRPGEVIGVYPWALHAAALAIGLTLMAGHFAKADGPENRWRVSVAALAAMSSMAFALVLVLNAAALTVALAASVAAAMWFDRRFDLPAMSAFVSAGVVSVGYRLVADPGLEHGIDGPLSDMLLAYGGATVFFGAALWLVRPLKRPTARVMLETGTASALGLTLSILLLRGLGEIAEGDTASHWAMGMQGVIWMLLCFVQLYRTAVGGRVLGILRYVLATLFGLISLGALAFALTVANPLVDDWLGAVIGWPVLNTLAVAYLLPGLLLIAGSVRLPDTLSGLRMPGIGLGGLLVVHWGFSAIRHFWQGSAGMELDTGMSQPELYTYTVVLLLIGAGLFYQSLAQQHALLRKAGLVVIGLAVAKVFFVDISGLQGLTRVFSLLVLGISLSGLAWLNRWAQQRNEAIEDAET